MKKKILKIDKYIYFFFFTPSLSPVDALLFKRIFICAMSDTILEKKKKL